MKIDATNSQNEKNALPLPRKIWAGWSQHPNLRQPGTTLWLRSPEFTAPGLAQQAVLYVATWGDYTVALDDQPLPVPAGSMPSTWDLHRIELPTACAPGAHRLVFTVTPWSRFPFLLASVDFAHTLLEIEEDTEVERILQRIASGPEWEFSLDQGQSWQPVWAFEGVWAEPYGFPCNAPDDWTRLTTGNQRMTTQQPARMVAFSSGQWHWVRSAVGATLQARTQSMPVQPPALGRHQLNPVMFHLLREDVCRVRHEWLAQHEGRLPWVLLDVGHELFGRLSLRNTGKTTLQLATVTGETANETHAYNRRMIDIFTLEPGQYATTSLVGLRYIKIVALSADNGDWQLEYPLVQAVELDAPRVGRFRCNDGLLNAIWEQCAETIALCSQNEIWDAPKRDMLPWMGDLHMESLAFLHLYGAHPLICRSLCANRETGPAVQTPLEERVIPTLSEIWGGPAADINGIPSYTCWWALALRDYVLYSGDLDFVRQQQAELTSLLEHLQRGLTREGWTFAAYGSPASFIDHTILPFEQEELTMQALAAGAFQAGAQMLEWAGENAEATPWQHPPKALAEVFWQRAQQLGLSRLRHHPAAAAVALGVVEPVQVRQLFDAILDRPDEHLKTPWWRSLDLLALGMAGETQDLLTRMREHWKLHLDSGHSTLWEAMHPSWMQCEDPHAATITREDCGYGGHRMSLCHGWGAGPMVALARHILGLYPLEPGWKTFAFRPQLGDLEWVDGVVPTPAGPISAQVARHGNEYKVNLDYPDALSPVT